MACASGLVEADRRFRQGIVIEISDGADRGERTGVEKPAAVADRDIRHAQISTAAVWGCRLAAGKAVASS